MPSSSLDRGSKVKFKDLLAELQKSDITVYALQIPDRTGGAYRRNQPKAAQVVTALTEGTGGRIFPFEQAQTADLAVSRLPSPDEVLAELGRFRGRLPAAQRLTRDDANAR